jgi:hypothetical protein
MQSARLEYLKQTLMEIKKMSVQALASASGTLDQSRRARFALPILVYRINEHCRAYFARIIAALDETRRREAARIIHRYRHLIDNDRCSD